MIRHKYGRTALAAALLAGSMITLANLAPIQSLLRQNTEAAGGFLHKASGKVGNGYLAQRDEAPQIPALLTDGDDSQTSPVMQIQGDTATNTLPVQSSRGQSTTADETTAMPANVRNWLEHLAETERARQNLCSQQLASATGTYASLQGAGAIEAGQDDTESSARSTRTDPVRTQTGEMRQKWNNLISQFEQVTPPDECVPVRNRYSPVLQETAGMMSDIEDALTRSSQDPQGALAVLTSMQGKSDHRIGDPARETDQLVAAICGKYKTTKWFSVQADFGSSMLSLK